MAQEGKDNGGGGKELGEHFEGRIGVGVKEN
jgi:hypothetical protein